MDKMILFHGSKYIIEKPSFDYKNSNSDYGSGFYCTCDLESAKEWACRNSSNGIVNKYSLDIRNLKILDLTDSKYSIFHWMTLLIKNRIITQQVYKYNKTVIDYLFENYSIDLSSYDLVIGYRADDAYFKFPIAFIEGRISINQIEEVYRLGELGKQVVVISKKAFDKIKFLEFLEVSEDYHFKYRNRIISANTKLENLLSRERNIYEDTIIDIVRKSKK